MPAALGERFRAAREARGLSLSDVAEQIRIRSVYLAAIEDENWDAIDAPVYARGFIRTYARFLGLEPEEMVATFTDRAAPPPHSDTGPMPAASTSESGARGLSPMIWIAALVAVAMVAFVVFNELSFRPSTQEATAQVIPGIEPTALSSPEASASPEASVSPEAIASASAPQTIAIALSQPSWLRLTVDGNVSMEGTFPAGTMKRFHGRAAVLRIGNAGGVEVFVDGRDLGKLGAAGDVVQRSFSL